MGREGSTAIGPRESGEHWAVRLSLLGGFRAEHLHLVPESAWQQRRSAKALVKLMACHPTHAIHREQILDALWPEVDFVSALNSFGKALHVARRALEPEMPNRGVSSYLRLSDEVLTLVTDSVWIDVDHFEQEAENALRGDITALDGAIELYSGELLPEDTYESWTTARRTALTDLHLRLLLAAADALERRGQRDAAIDRLGQVVRVDPAREDVHRRLMQLHALSGRRLLALRQYQLCREALKQEVDAEPESATVALYEEIRADRIAEVPSTVAQTKPAGPITLRSTEIDRASSTPLVGRDRVLHLLSQQRVRAENGEGSTVFVIGALGVGKTRVMEELARESAVNGSLVLWGAGLRGETALPYAPFVHALEGYVASCDVSERVEWADRFPTMAAIIPSLTADVDVPLALPSVGIEHEQVFSAITRMLVDLASRRTVVLVLEDLHAASEPTLQLLEHLMHIAAHRRLLIVGTHREDDVSGQTRLGEIACALIRQGRGHHIRLPLLQRDECDALVDAIVDGESAPTSLLDHVWTASSGNPFLITELVKAMEDGATGAQVERRARFSDPEVPQPVAAVVNAHVRQMDDAAHLVLALVALAGPEVTFPEIRLAVNQAIDPGMTETDLLDVLDAGLQTGMMTERGLGYSFKYPLFRAALCNQLSRQRRAQFHAAIAHAVEEYRPGEVELLAYHYGRNDDRDRGATYLKRAAERARATGMQEAEEGHLWRLLERLHMLGRTEDAREVQDTLRSLLQGVGHEGVLPPHELQPHATSHSA